MTSHDWRTCSDEEGTALVAREMGAWLATLSWDIYDSWRVVEPARRAGQLPGFVVRDDAGRIAGWTAYTVDRDTVQVFAFNAADRETGAHLVDAIEESSDVARATHIVFSVRDSTPSLAAVLADRGYRVEPYRYLAKVLAGGSTRDGRIGPWQSHHRSMARLCARAYRTAPGIRAFALDDSLEAWDDYIRGLVTTSGCGRFAPELSAAAMEDTGELSAGAIVTWLAPGVIHIAQLAVDPAVRGRGLGRQLVETVEVAGVTHGAREATLLVAAANTPAVRVYEGRGFVDRAAFVVALRRASGTGGEARRVGKAFQEPREPASSPSAVREMR